MRFLLSSLVILILSGCKTEYDRSLVLDNNSSKLIEVIVYSSAPEMKANVFLARGEESVLFHSTSHLYSDETCLDFIDSVTVNVIGFSRFRGDMLNPNQWLHEQYKQSYIDVDFCTFIFTDENVY